MNLTSEQIEILELSGLKVETFNIKTLEDLRRFKNDLPKEKGCCRCGKIESHGHYSTHDITGVQLIGKHCFICWGKVNGETYLDHGIFKDNRLDPIHPGANVY